jgi:hypothetical protein
MIALAFIGLIFTELKQDGAWNYWRFLCIIFAMISIGMNFFLRRKEKVSFLAAFVHEIFHWAGLLFFVTIISIMVEVGIIGRFLSSITILTLLAMSTYLAGVYTDISLAFVRVVLRYFCDRTFARISVSVSSNYTYCFNSGFFIFWMYLKRKHKHHNNENKEQI